MKIVIIGAGNVATVLGGKLHEAGQEIVQVFSRQPEHALRLAEELGCAPVSRWEDIYPDADLYIAALSDNALRGLGKVLSLPGRLVVHTGGAVPMEVLLEVSEHCGVLYPLQSLRKELRPYAGIPLLVDAHIPDDLQRITDIARSISGQVQTADNDTRLRLHVAAVMVNNFTNHLYVLAEEYCRKEGVDFSMLLPLIRETAGRLSDIAPEDAQTGPAVRGDEATVEEHLKLIGNYKDIKDIYTLFTQQIRSRRQGVN
jgi:predicted short-subunit dehydrogenase-like oxidoreductase (DUF2520 family)